MNGAGQIYVSGVKRLYARGSGSGTKPPQRLLNRKSNMKRYLNYGVAAFAALTLLAAACQDDPAKNDDDGPSSTNSSSATNGSGGGSTTTNGSGGSTTSGMGGNASGDETNCTDGVDNDNNGFTDCDDFACQGTVIAPTR